MLHSLIHSFSIYLLNSRDWEYYDVRQSVSLGTHSLKEEDRHVNKKLQYDVRALPEAGTRQLGAIIRE